MTSRHEIAHLAKASQNPEQKAPADGHPCALCLSYAHLAGLAKADGFKAQLLASLSFGLAPAADIEGTSPPAPTARTRGPPTS